jgi:hypothetical protein
MIWDVHPGSGFFYIPDPGYRGQKGTRSRIRIRKTGHEKLGENDKATVVRNIIKQLGGAVGGRDGK